MQKSIDILKGAGFDEFYPVSDTIKSCEGGMWQIGMAAKLRDRLGRAKQGDRDAESRLCNRLGQLRRNVSTLGVLTQDLQDVVKESVSWLRSTGRVVDFSQKDPALWITMRDGKSPRF